MKITPETLAQALDSIDREQVKALLKQMRETGTFMKQADEDHPTNQAFQRFLSETGFASKLAEIAKIEDIEPETMCSAVLLGFFLGLFTPVELPEAAQEVAQGSC